MPVSAVTRGRLRKSQFWIEDRRSETQLAYLRTPSLHASQRQRLARKDCVSLPVPAVVGTCDHRQQRPGGFPLTPIVLHAAAAGIEKIDPLRAVHRTAAAKADNQVGAKFLGIGQAIVDV